jgi:hypothetical protein
MMLTRPVGRKDFVGTAMASPDLANAGSQPAGIAHTLELLALAYESRPPIEDVTDVVTTGSEDRTASSRDTSVVVRELFHKAEESVLVAGYAVYQGQRAFQALAHRMLDRGNLRVRMFLDTASQLVKRFSHRFRSILRNSYAVASRSPVTRNLLRLWHPTRSERFSFFWRTRPPFASVVQRWRNPTQALPSRRRSIFLIQPSGASARGRRLPRPLISKSTGSPIGLGPISAGALLAKAAVALSAVAAVYAPSIHQAIRIGGQMGGLFVGIILGKLLILMVRPSGFEPPTFCSGGNAAKRKLLIRWTHWDHFSTSPDLPFREIANPSSSRNRRNQA